MEFHVHVFTYRLPSLRGAFEHFRGYLFIYLIAAFFCMVCYLPKWSFGQDSFSLGSLWASVTNVVEGRF